MEFYWVSIVEKAETIADHCLGKDVITTYLTGALFTHTVEALVMMFLVQFP